MIGKGQKKHPPENPENPLPAMTSTKPARMSANAKARTIEARILLKQTLEESLDQEENNQ